MKNENVVSSIVDDMRLFESIDKTVASNYAVCVDYFKKISKKYTKQNLFYLLDNKYKVDIEVNNQKLTIDFFNWLQFSNN
jgi:hypothetical protein